MIALKSLKMTLKALLGLAMAAAFLFSSIASAQGSAKKIAQQKKAAAIVTAKNSKKSLGKNGKATLTTTPVAPAKTETKITVGSPATIPSASNLTATVQTPAAEEKKPASRVSGLFAAAGTQNLYDRQDGTFHQSVDFMSRLSVKLSDNYSLTAAGGYGLDPKDETASDWADVAVLLSRKGYELGSRFTLAPRLSTSIPVSKDSRVRQSMQSSAGVSLALGFQEGVLREGLGITASVGATRFIHQYEEAVDGSVNSQYSFKQALSVEYGIGKVGLSLELIHRNAQSYQGFLGEAFEHTEELSYQVSDHMGVAIGHTLGGSMLKPDGRESNFSLLNDNDSKVYGSITLLF